MLDIIEQMSAWILPRVCVGCGFNSGCLHLDLCQYCKKNLPWLAMRCYSCGLRLDTHNEAIICDKCRNQPPEFNCLYALFEYAPPLTKLINQLKFSKKLNVGALLGYLLTETIMQSWYRKKSLPEVIIPVPLHERRLKQRGYNQALEICTPVSKNLQIPLNTQLCKRIKYTRQQTRLDKSQRIDNLEGAFSVNLALNYKHVAIVDDVVTTGSTVKALSIALRNAGVEIIDVWCVCRA
jgi:ComF family protein